MVKHRIRQKFLSIVLCLAMMISMIGISFQQVAIASPTANVTIDGRPVSFADQPPVIIDGRTLVPVRGVFEALGFDVDWDASNQRATLTREGDTVIITVGSASFTTNGVSHTLDVPAQIIGSRTMLPFRAVVESVGYSVGWNGATSTVVISTVDDVVITDIERTVEDFLRQFVTLFDRPGAKDLATGVVYVRGDYGAWIPAVARPLVSVGGTRGNYYGLWGFRFDDQTALFDVRGNILDDTTSFFDIRTHEFGVSFDVALRFQVYDFNVNGFPLISIGSIDWFNMPSAADPALRFFAFVDGGYRQVYETMYAFLYRDSAGRLLNVVSAICWRGCCCDVDWSREGLFTDAADNPLVAYHVLIDGATMTLTPTLPIGAITQVEPLTEMQDRITVSVTQSINAYRGS